MDQKEAFIRVIEILGDLDLDYMIVGGFAVGYWGRPRATHDLDIVLEVKEAQKDRLIKVFRKEGWYISEEAIEEALRLRKGFNIIHPESDLKVDFWIVGEDRYSQERFRRKIKQKIFGIEAFFSSPEDLILMKLEWYKESELSKHFLDAKSVWRLQKDILDREYLERWAKYLGIDDLLAQIIG